ncbi:MAG TPA: type I methionyl aminopeptidase [Capsulimonadaceae bacterium]|jgi:methionyl aminopeptidase
MVRLKSSDEIEMMRLAGRVVAEALAAMRDAIVPDQTRTVDLDEIAGDVFAKRGAVSAFLGYKPSFSAVKYKHNTCLSVNEEVVHGVPGKRVLRNGDIISLDTGASVGGWHADAAITVVVGGASPAAEKLLSVTRQAMLEGIAQARPGKRIGDISAAIQWHAERSGYGVVRSLVGHGIGRSPHEEPQVPNYGRSNQGLLLKPGMVICIEPMVNIGTGEVNHVPGDDWTIVTADRSLSAHFEHTVAVTENGPDLLTVDFRTEK